MVMGLVGVCRLFGAKFLVALDVLFDGERQGRPRIDCT